MLNSPPLIRGGFWSFLGLLVPAGSMFAGSARLFLIQAASGDGAVGIGSGFHADVLLVLWTVMHFKSAIGHDCSAFLNLFKVKYIIWEE